jgi:DNA primase
MNKEETKALKYLANQRIHKIIEALGIEYTERYKYIFAPCPIHKGDRSDGWSFHLDLGVYQCFTRACHEEHGKDVFGLVCGVLDIPFVKAVQWVKEVMEQDGKLDLSEVAHQQSNKAFVNRVKQRQAIIYPEECLQRLRYHEYLEGRGYPRNIVEEYQIGIADSPKYKRMFNRVIVPVRDIDGNIVGFTGRTLYEDWKDRKIGKWEHSQGFPKEQHLFNIHKAAKYISETGDAIICEGPLDVLRLEQADIHNGVAIFGRTLHNGQIGLLMKAGARRLIIALDADNAGQTGAAKAMELAKSFFEVEKISLEQGDIGNLSVEKVKELFSGESIRN